MEDILKEVKTYDIAKLRVKLTEVGVKVGPISPATKSLFQKRLANKLFESQGGVREEQQDDSPQTAATDTSVEKVSVSDGPVKQPDAYFVVCLPENDDTDGTESEIKGDGGHLIFTDKVQALKTAKTHKGSRFKVFKSEEEANSFCQSNKDSSSSLQTPKKSLHEESSNCEVSVPADSCPFKGPRPQDMVVVRKAIDRGDVDAFRTAIWDNPRYLVSGGDTPAIYQEGFRYTALHVAAMKNQPEICRVVLDTLENPEFVNRLYSQSQNTDETQGNRINFLVDLYLNMPDKGNCESPLHMACKFGHEEVVEVLAAHPRTDRTKINKWGDTPRDIICSRCKSPNKALKEKIAVLLEGQCYVPLIRSDDNSTPPVIAAPWSPDVTRSPLDIPQVSWSPKDPSMTVKAYAGPMSPSNAGLFHKKWTTPPSQSPDQMRKYHNIKRSDCEKGMERIGRQLAHDMALPWLEHWNFLGLYVDLASDRGLDLLEEYLKKRVWLSYLKQFKEKHNIGDIFVDYTQFLTPINREKKGSFDTCDSSVDRDSVFRDVKKLGAENCDINKVSDAGKVGLLDSVEVSPVTSLSQCFAKMKLLDESWSEKATINTTDPSLGSSPKLFNTSDNSDRSASNSDPSSDISQKLSNSSGSTDRSVSNLNNSQNAICTTDTSADDKLNSKSVEAVAGTTDTLKDEENEVFEVPPEDVIRTLKRSDSSHSISSFVTAAEDFTDSSQAYKRELSETGTMTPCIYIKDSAIFEQLLKLSLERSSGETDQIEITMVKFVVQIKSSAEVPVTSVTIVLVPKEESANQLLAWEDVEVGRCDGDVAGLVGGDVLEIGEWDGDDKVTVSQSTVQAYISRSSTLPKLGFIHGPQPTREDLNVSRALGSIVISPECHPLVFQWKISLKKFQSDSNFRWQSPAKLRSRLSRPSPQRSPLSRSSPVIPYGSPVAITNLQPRTGSLRTKLFPPIFE